MNKDKVLKILNKQLEKSNDITTYLDLEDWFNVTKEYIGNIYGFDSIQYKKFKMYKSIPSPPVESHLIGLVSDLKAYIEVIDSVGLPNKKEVYSSNLNTSNETLSFSNEINELPKNRSKIFILIGSIIGALSGLATTLDWFNITPKILFDTLKNLFK